MIEAWEVLHDDATMLFASLLFIVVMFLILRVAHASQRTALMMAMTPVLLAITLERGLSLGLI